MLLDFASNMVYIAGRVVLGSLPVYLVCYVLSDTFSFWRKSSVFISVECKCASCIVAGRDTGNGPDVMVVRCYGGIWVSAVGECTSTYDICDGCVYLKDYWSQWDLAPWDNRPCARRNLSGLLNKSLNVTHEMYVYIMCEWSKMYIQQVLLRHYCTVKLCLNLGATAGQSFSRHVIICRICT